MLISRRRALLAAALAAPLSAPLFAPLSARAEGALAPWTGAPSLPIDLLRPDGAPLTLTDLRGKVVLVNFWATWCAPCVAEMPSLQRLRDMLGADGFEVLGVNLREGPARIDAFTQQTGVRFPIVRDTDGAVARAWGARIFPSSYVIDRTGRVRYVLAGEADWTSPALVATIRALL
jgi:thiol-disulfide isomerase/thioredoxin